jgi:hypothetical protein
VLTALALYDPSARHAAPRRRPGVAEIAWTRMTTARRARWLRPSTCSWPWRSSPLFVGGLLGRSGALSRGGRRGSWWVEPLRPRIDRVRHLGVAIVVLAVAWLVVEVVTVAPTVLDAFSHLLVFLLL